jgi:hypothetical protein
MVGNRPGGLQGLLAWPVIGMAWPGLFIKISGLDFEKSLFT